MLVSILINNILNTLQSSGVYKPENFILSGINDGIKLTSYLTLYDERRVSVSAAGSRNVIGFPTSSDAKMICPLYVTNGTSGNRLNPVKMIDFELSNTEWEGEISDADSDYYIAFSPVYYLDSELLCTPIQNTGTMYYNLIGVFTPVDVESTDELEFPEQYTEALYHYGLFHAYVSIPGKVEECMEAYKMYIEIINLMIQDMASRFPSDQGIKPVPVEFNKDLLNRYNMDGRIERSEPTTQGEQL